MKATRSTCIWPMCSAWAADRYDQLICRKHAAYIWLIVERDREETGQDIGRLQARARSADPEEREKPAPERGYIYYLLMGDYIKIGYTKNLDRRMRQYPPNAELLAANRGTPDDEKFLHQKFAAYLDSGREWYRDVPEIQQHIERAKQRRDSVDVPSRRGNAHKKPPARPRSWTGRT